MDSSFTAGRPSSRPPKSGVRQYPSRNNSDSVRYAMQWGKQQNQATTTVAVGDEKVLQEDESIQATPYAHANVMTSPPLSPRHIGTGVGPSSEVVAPSESSYVFVNHPESVGLQSVHDGGDGNISISPEVLQLLLDQAGLSRQQQQQQHHDINRTTHHVEQKNNEHVRGAGYSSLKEKQRENERERGLNPNNPNPNLEVVGRGFNFDDVKSVERDDIYVEGKALPIPKMRKPPSIGSLKYVSVFVSLPLSLSLFSSSVLLLSFSLLSHFSLLLSLSLSLSSLTLYPPSPAFLFLSP